jgi:hypothetical protein
LIYALLQSEASEGPSFKIERWMKLRLLAEPVVTCPSDETRLHSDKRAKVSDEHRFVYQAFAAQDLGFQQRLG